MIFILDNCCIVVADIVAIEYENAPAYTIRIYCWSFVFRMVREFLTKLLNILWGEQG